MFVCIEWECNPTCFGGCYSRKFFLWCMTLLCAKFFVQGHYWFYKESESPSKIEEKRRKIKQKNKNGEEEKED